MNDPNDNLRAARLLAGILYADTGIDIEPTVLCAFINNRWDRVAPLAHRVHKEPDVTKASSPVQPVKLASHMAAAKQLRDLAASLEMNSMGGISSQLRDIARVLE